MKAAVVTANEQVEYKEISEPQTRPGTVKIRVKASGICGSDVPRVLYNGVHFYPIVLGHEFSGVVTETGEGVSRIKVGDKVSGAPLLPCGKCPDCRRGNFSLCKHYSFAGSREQGSNADYIVLPEENVVPFDPSLSFEQGALFEPSTVALHGVLQNRFTGGGTAAILGCGTIGLFTLQWARILGARQIVAFDVDDRRLALARRLGADACVNTTEEGFIQTALDFTGGAGFDDVFETAGAAPTMYMAFQLAANKARVCFIGTPHVDLTFSPSLWEQMNRKEFTLTGSWMSYSAPFPGKEWEWTAHYFATGQLRYDPELIGAKYPMSRAQEAFMLYKTPGAVSGRILLMNDMEE